MAGRAVRIAVFAKAPVPGEVKTRLIPVLGAEGAARLHRRLVRHALAAATAARSASVELWCAPDATHAFLGECVTEFGVSLQAQGTGDLGERMARCFAFDDGATLLIGSDIPAMDAACLDAAAAALAESDAVFVPAEDGGYVLVGLRAGLGAARDEVFRDIAWGSERVMQQTRERLGAAGLTWRELPPLWDLDRPGDLARLASCGMGELVESGP
jgi:rSAM/selenodomain-associated transferase 1